MSIKKMYTDEFKQPLPHLQLESVADCASRLRLLSKALDISDLRLGGTTRSWRHELVRLQGAGLGLDIKQSLLEAWGLVLLANNQLEPQKSGKILSQFPNTAFLNGYVFLKRTLCFSVRSAGQTGIEYRAIATSHELQRAPGVVHHV